MQFPGSFAIKWIKLLMGHSPAFKTTELFIFFKVSKKQHFHLRRCLIQTVHSNRENQSCVWNLICVSRRQYTLAPWMPDSSAVFMVCESQFSDVIIQVEVVSLIVLSGQGDSLSSLHLAFLNRRYITVLLTGTLSQHLAENVWSSVSGMTKFAIVKDNKLMSSLIWLSWRDFSATLALS